MSDLVSDPVSGSHGDLPRAELHLHIEGTLEPEQRFAFAQRNSLALAYETPEDLRRAYTFTDLPGFLAMYYDGMSVLCTEQDYYDLAMAYFRKASEQNVVYAEVFFDPQAHTSRGVPFEAVISGLDRARNDAADGLGLSAKLIMCFLRDMSQESAMRTLDQAAPYQDKIIGVGLDSDEADNPPVKFADVFKRARDEGYRLTMHCDPDDKDSVRHIWQCLDDIGVERLDHGTNAVEDKSLLGRLGRDGIGLTVCPISNRWLTGTPKTAEIKTLLDNGAKPTVNSDDPAYFGGYLGENFAEVAADLTGEEVRALTRNAFEIAWLTDEEKARYLT